MLLFHTQGHTDEMWGLAIHPSENKFVTCAYDRLLYMWNADSHEAIWGKQMEVRVGNSLIAFLLCIQCIVIELL